MAPRRHDFQYLEEGYFFETGQVPVIKPSPFEDRPRVYLKVTHEMAMFMPDGSMHLFTPTMSVAHVPIKMTMP